MTDEEKAEQYIDDVLIKQQGNIFNARDLYGDGTRWKSLSLERFTDIYKHKIKLYEM